LGVTLFELTTDKRLFKRGDNVSTLAAVAECKIPDPTELVPGYSPALWDILKKALSKNRNERFATAKEMADALDGFSRSRGRVVTSATLGSFMEELFGAQRERYQAWLDEVRSERPVPTPEQSFRGPSTGDDNAILVGADVKESGPVTDRKDDRPRLPADRTSDVRGFDKEKAKAKEAAASEPEPPPAPKADPVTKETSKVWLWAVVLLVVGIGSVWWATHHM